MKCASRSPAGATAIRSKSNGRGLPITHLVFPGHQIDHQTLAEALGHLEERFPIARTIFVADGGVMTEANVDRPTPTRSCAPWTSYPCPPS